MHACHYEKILLPMASTSVVRLAPKAFAHLARRMLYGTFIDYNPPV